jgi:4-hydroxy-tetrahydrodipicolinate synthase
MSKRRLSPNEVKPLICGGQVIMLNSFKSGTELDEEGIREHTNWMIENGIVEGTGVLTVGGSNGECFSMGIEERKRLFEIVLDEAKGRVPVIAGCNHSGTWQVVELAQHAEKVGADAVMVMPPYYENPASSDAVYAHYLTVAKNTHIGIMVYNNQWVTGQDLSVELLERLAEIGNIVAIKECTPYFFKLKEVLRKLGDRWSIITAFGEYWMPFDYILGADGFVTLTGNWAPRLVAEVHEACKAKDIQRCEDLYDQIFPVNSLIDNAGPYQEIATAKEIARLAGRPISRFERPPLLPISEARKEQLKTVMQKSGMLQT